MFARVFFSVNKSVFDNRSFFSTKVPYFKLEFVSGWVFLGMGCSLLLFFFFGVMFFLFGGVIFRAMFYVIVLYMCVVFPVFMCCQC